MLIAPLTGVGRAIPCPLKAGADPLLVRRQGLARGLRALIQILRYGAWGTPCQSTQEQEVILHSVKKPAGRICVNTPTTHGSIGLTTGWIGDDARVRRWGAISRPTTSAEASANIKRLAYELRPVVTEVAAARTFSVREADRLKAAPASGLPQAPDRPSPKASRPRRWRPVLGPVPLSAGVGPD